MLRQQLAAQLKPADIWQTDIKDRQRRGLATRLFERRQPALEGFHRKPFLRQHIDQRLSDTDFVFHQPNQRLLHCLSLN
ncbi:hypothetical protein D3C86_1963420 [compost metagenome]